MTPTRNQGIGIALSAAAILFGGGGTFVVWAADQRYEKKGAITELANQVEINSQQQTATMASVDTLLVQVLGERIKDLEKTIEELNSQVSMTGAERELLRQSRQEVADARQERQATLKRILERRAQ